MNPSLSTSICIPNALPAVGPKPGTTLKTPSGIPASMASSATRNADKGDCSAGFRIKLFPAAKAGANFQQAINNG